MRVGLPDRDEVAELPFLDDGDAVTDREQVLGVRRHDEDGGAARRTADGSGGRSRAGCRRRRRGSARTARRPAARGRARGRRRPSACCRPRACRSRRRLSAGCTLSFSTMSEQSRRSAPPRSTRSGWRQPSSEDMVRLFPTDMSRKPPWVSRCGGTSDDAHIGRPDDRARTRLHAAVSQVGDVVEARAGQPGEADDLAGAQHEVDRSGAPAVGTLEAQHLLARRAMVGGCPRASGTRGRPASSRARRGRARSRASRPRGCRRG